MIYFITQDNQYVKIGYTNKDPGDRLMQLQIGNPRSLVISKVIHGGKAKESALHTRFGLYLARGEWYWLSREIKRYIATQKEYGINPVEYAKDNQGVVTILNNNRR